MITSASDWAASDGAAPERATSRRWIASITTEAVVLLMFVAGLAWTPYWLGSNRLLPWSINALLFPGLVTAYEMSLLIRGLQHPVPVRAIRIPAVLFAVAASWGFLQNVTWTPGWLHHPIWELASQVLGREVPGSISVDRDLTALALLRLMTAASVFWLALQLGPAVSRARILLWSVVGIASAYAAVGLFAYAFMPEGAIFPEIGKSDTVVVSTFVNQNHFATFAGIALVTALALMLRIYRRELQQSGNLVRLRVAALIHTTGTIAAAPLALTFVILAALLMTGSRGGILSAFLGIIALGTFNAMRFRRQFRRNEALFLVFAGVAIGAAFIAFADVFVAKLEEQGFGDQSRLTVYLTALRSILSNPLLGYGYGTFSAAFSMFRDDSLGVWLFWDMAHNVYLEILQGLGLVIGSALIASVALLVAKCLHGAISRKRNVTIPAAAASASFLVGLHSLVDFSLQIQAVTLIYMALLGVGVAQASDPEPRDRRQSPRQVGSRTRPSAAAWPGRTDVCCREQSLPGSRLHNMAI